MALTDHLDRSPDKKLLRGRIGRIHSWVLPRDEPSRVEDGERVLHKLPVVVFIKFDDAEWILDGLSEPGLYPVKLVTKSWYLDKNRVQPKLRIRRQ